MKKICILVLFLLSQNIGVSVHAEEIEINNPKKIKDLTGYGKVQEYHPKPIPEIAFIDGEKKEYLLEAFDGKVVLLNFWATWCMPCRVEMKDLDHFQKANKKKNFKVIAIAEGSTELDNDINLVKEFYQKNEIKYLDIYLDIDSKGKKRSLFEYYAINSLPTSILIDQSGNEVGRINGVIDFTNEEIVSNITKHITE